MIALSRTDTSIVGRWWWTVDRWTLVALGLLIALGCLLTLAASPAVAVRIGLDPYHFVRRQFIFLLPALAFLFGASLLTPLWVRRVALAGFVLFLLLMALTLVMGSEIKGAHRWLFLGGLSLQPSEFVKPCFAVVAAWMFAEQRRGRGFPGNLVSILLMVTVVAILVAQPDFGMTVVIVAVWLAQFFLAGLPMLLLGAGGALGAVGLTGAYFLSPHVASRIDRFLDPAAGDTYQIHRAMEAFQAGGLFGRGPGDGLVKTVLPDAHTDFIFAVAGEEYGVILCLVIIAIFAFIVLRSLGRLLSENNLFVLLAGSGLVAQFGLQAIINIGVNLRLMPTKGMTLPFISYGGSSLMALAFGMGLLLALTRTRPSLGGEL